MNMIDCKKSLCQRKRPFQAFYGGYTYFNFIFNFMYFSNKFSWKSKQKTADSNNHEKEPSMKKNT